MAPLWNKSKGYTSVLGTFRPAFTVPANQKRHHALLLNTHFCRSNGQICVPFGTQGE
jgi:hypothetical protein